MYAVSFYGCKAGALGLCYSQEITISRKELPDDFEHLAPDEQMEQVRLAVYRQGYEHLSGVAFAEHRRPSNER